MRAFVRYFNTIVISAAIVVAALAAAGVLKLPPSQGMSGAAGLRVAVGEVGLGAAPDFLDVIEPAPEDRTALSESTTGLHYRLVDQQIDLRGDAPVRYTRLVVDIANRQVAEMMSTRLIDFFPDYQSVVLHEIVVVRDGAREDRASDVFIDRIQAEDQLNQGVVTGLERGLVRIPSLQAGDTLDISWSIVGGHPSMRDRLSEFVGAQFFVSSPKARIRVLAPETALVEVLGDVPEPEIVAHEGYQSLLMPAQAVNPDLEVDPFNRYQHASGWLVSEFEDWNAVKRWGEALYEVGRPSAEVREVADRIRSSSDDPEMQLVNAIQFVQDHVSYFAVTLGVQGFVPASTEETLRTRNGDCKAKTLLLVQLLRALGVEAHAAFVNSVDGRGLDDYVASPLAFDHVIVRVTHEGETYWVDPTINLERGNLNRRPQPDYDMALVLDGGDEGLVDMPDPEIGEPWTDIREAFYLPLGPDDELVIDAQLVYRGTVARFVRSAFEHVSDSEREDYFLQTYQRFEELEVDNFSYFDNEQDNTIRVNLELSAPRFFGKPDEEGQHWQVLYTDTLVSPSPFMGELDAEAAMPFPMNTRHSVTVQLPGPSHIWTFPSEEDEVDNEAFMVRRTVSYADSILQLDWRQTFKTEWVVTTPELMEDAGAIPSMQSYELYSEASWI